MFKEIIFFFQKVFSSRYVIKGKCKCCGACCRNIIFYIGEKKVSTPEEFEKMKKFNKKYNHFFITGKGEKGELLFTCKSLSENNLCKDYQFRSIDCRLYPKISQKFVNDGGVPLDGCGYSFCANKKFDNYLR